MQKKQINKLSVKYGWHHWCAAKKMYSVIRLSSGGGVREKKWDRSTELREVFEDMQRMFFPNNKSSKGIYTTFYIRIIFYHVFTYQLLHLKMHKICL